MNKGRYYIKTEIGDGDSYYDSYQFAMDYAAGIAECDTGIERIILYIHYKQNTSLLENCFDSIEINKLRKKGLKIAGCPVLFKIETPNSYDDEIFAKPSDIVICCAMDSDDIFNIDDFNKVKYIIAVPFKLDAIKEWIDRWEPKEISNKKKL